MINSTLCYVLRGNDVLMLHRVKKKNDINKDKWIGIGGKFEENESPDDCLLREALEETGLTLTTWQCRGIVTFLSDRYEGEYMYLFTADGFEGELKGAKCMEDGVVVFGNIITGKGPGKSFDFAYAIVTSILGATKAGEISSAMQY